VLSSRVLQRRLIDKTQKETDRKKGQSMRAWKDIFLAIVILFVGGYVGAALLGVVP
jgi:hypothetical protein